MKSSHLFLLCAVTMASLMMLTTPSCDDKDEEVNIVPDFEASFKDGDSIAPATILIVNKTTGANAYKWTFEGGSPGESTAKDSIEVSYDSARTYTISLTAYYNAESKSLSKTVTVRSNVVPPGSVVSDFSVSFAPTTLDYNAPAEVTFTNSSVNATSYSWTFENGAPPTSTAKDPVVTFANYGLHSVTLTASNAAGSSDTTTQSLKIYPGELVCSPNEYWEGKLWYQDATITTPMEIGYVRYQFAAGRSGGTSRTIIHIPREIVQQLAGLAEEIHYDLPLSWDWLIDDNGQQLKVEAYVDENGAKGTELSTFALENGEFTLTNTVLDATLQYALAVKVGTEHAPRLVSILEQDITYTKKTANENPPEEVVNNFSVSFGSTGDYAPAEATFTDNSDNADSYSWTFQRGDPHTSTAQNPTVTFADYGLHSVTLTASNAAGSDTKTDTLKIYPGVLVCNSNEYWEGKLWYQDATITTPMEIGYVRYQFAAGRSGGTSGTIIHIPAEVVYQLLGVAEQVHYELPLNWDWLIDGNGQQQLKVEVLVNGSSGGSETSNFALGNGGFALTNTVLDDALQNLLTNQGRFLFLSYSRI